MTFRFTPNVAGPSHWPATSPRRAPSPDTARRGRHSDRTVRMYPPASAHGPRGHRGRGIPLLAFPSAGPAPRDNSRCYGADRLPGLPRGVVRIFRRLHCRALNGAASLFVQHRAAPATISMTVSMAAVGAPRTTTRKENLA